MIFFFWLVFSSHVFSSSWWTRSLEGSLSLSWFWKQNRVRHLCGERGENLLQQCRSTLWCIPWCSLQVFFPLYIHPGNSFCPPHTKAQRAEALLVLWPLGSLAWLWAGLWVWPASTFQAQGKRCPLSWDCFSHSPLWRVQGFSPWLCPCRAGLWWNWESPSPAVGSELWGFFYPQVVQQQSKFEMEHWNKNTFWVIF